MALKVRRQRRKHATKLRLHKPVWVDPFPHIPGTEPEKRVFAALVLRGIYFRYQSQIPEFERGGRMFFLTPVNYKPDFVLPEYKIIIDPFSPFHHSLEEAAERDADKIARYSVAGYAYYHPWAVAPGVWTWDQYDQKVNTALNKTRTDRKIVGRSMGTMEMLARIPELDHGPKYPLTTPEDKAAKQSPGYLIGEFLGAGANSVAAANRRRRRPPRLRVTSGTRGMGRRGRPL